MSFIYYDTPKGKAYFEQTDAGIKVVADPTIVKKLQSGQLSATQSSVAKTSSFAAPRAGSLPDLKTTSEPTLPPTRKPGDMTMFANALNTAVEMGRARRQDANLDFMDAAFKPGQTSATSFSSLLANLNGIYDKTSEKLYDDAIRQVETQNKSLEDDKNSLKDLGITLLEKGVSGDTIQSILATGSLEAAMPAAAKALQGKMKDTQIMQTKDGIVEVSYDENGKPVATMVWKNTTPDGSTGRDTSWQTIDGKKVLVDDDTGEVIKEAGADINIETSVREDAFALLSAGKTAEEAFSLLRVGYGPEEADDATLQRILGLAVEAAADPVEFGLPQQNQSFGGSTAFTSTSPLPGEFTI